jgi:hypothetical protein
VTRLSALYALLDGSSVIQPIHHEAALEVWRYCEESAHWIFGMKTGQKLSDKILDALQSTAPEAMSRTEIFTKVMGRNGTKQDLDSALRVLLEYELIECWQEKTADGKTTEFFQYAEGTKCTNSPTDSPALADSAGSTTSNTKPDFVEFVDLNVETAIVNAASRLNTPTGNHTASSSFLSTPFMSTVTDVQLEGMCDEEREHWNYYHAYGKQEANLIW